jgi:hypothetical protein
MGAHLVVPPEAPSYSCRMPGGDDLPSKAASISPPFRVTSWGIEDMTNRDFYASRTTRSTQETT